MCIIIVYLQIYQSGDGFVWPSKILKYHISWSYKHVTPIELVESIQWSQRCTKLCQSKFRRDRDALTAVLAPTASQAALHWLLPGKPALLESETMLASMAFRCSWTHWAYEKHVKTLQFLDSGWYPWVMVWIYWIYGCWSPHMVTYGNNRCWAIPMPWTTLCRITIMVHGHSLGSSGKPDDKQAPGHHFFYR